MARTFTPAAKIAAGSCLAAVSAFTLAPMAAAATVPSSDAAASYLAAQLAASNHALSTTSMGSTYPDPGLSADSILALRSAGVAGNEASAATSAFAQGVSNYIGFGSDVYAGPTAKAMIVASAAGANPASFGGKNLVSTLKSLETDNGRFSDKSAYGDYSSTLTQSLAIIALTKAGVGADAKAVSFLKAQQCANGGFQMTPGAASCTPDNDATAFAVQALMAAGDVTSAKKATNYLASVQTADGGVAGGTGASAANSNSTGLAAVAFALTGDATHAAKARSFVSSLQYGCAFPASVRGAIAYDKTAYNTMKAAGASAKLAGSETRATAQGLFAFTQQPYLKVAGTGVAAAPTIDCGAMAPATSTPAPTPSAPKPSTSAPATPSTSAPSTEAPSSSAPTTTAPATTAQSAPSTTDDPATNGPRVDTGSTGQQDNTLLIALSGVGALAAAGMGVVVARRR